MVGWSGSAREHESGALGASKTGGKYLILATSDLGVGKERVAPSSTFVAGEVP